MEASVTQVDPDVARRRVYLIAVVAAMGGLLFGYDIGVISGAILLITRQFHLHPFGEEIVVSAVLAGAVLGAAFSGRVADIFGRKRTIIGTAVIFAIGSLLCSRASNPDWLVLYRVFLGVAIGVASFVVPLYLSEVAPPKVRGGLVSLNQLMITIGIVLSYLVDRFFAGVPDGWRYMLLAGALPAVALGVGTFFLPCTPRWLMSRGREKEARAVITALGEDAEREMDQMREALSEERGGTWSELCVPWLRTPLLIGIGIMFFQQITGINTVIYYAPTIFEKAGFKGADAALSATLGLGVVNVVMTCVSIWLLDKVGRRPLLLIGVCGMSVTLACLGAAFALEKTLGESLKWVSVGALVLYIASFALSLGPIAWLIIAEIYPLRIRGLAMSIATFTNWAMNFIVALTFLSIVKALGAAGAFWLYAGFGVLAWLFCFFRVPETKGRTLEEIEDHFFNRRPPRKL